MSDITDRITEELDYLGFSRADLSRGAGVSESTIRNWIRGTAPQAEMLYKVAKFLGVSLEYLITGKDSPQVHKMPPPLDDREKELLEDFRKLNETDKIESIAIIKLKLNLYQTLSATNGKSVTIKDC